MNSLSLGLAELGWNTINKILRSTPYYYYYYYVLLTTERKKRRVPKKFKGNYPSHMTSPDCYGTNQSIQTSK